MKWSKYFGLPKSPALKIIIICIYAVVFILVLGMIEVWFFA